MNYVFLDKIQMLNHFKRLLDGLHVLKNVDLYATDINAYLLSSELATILTGRAIMIEMYLYKLQTCANKDKAKIPDIHLFSNFIAEPLLPMTISTPCGKEAALIVVSPGWMVVSKRLLPVME